MVQVIPGAEAWSAEAGDVGVLVLHGFTGNPVSMRPLAEDLRDAGFAVELPRLPGHGTRWRELRRTGWPDWAREAAAALERLRARTRGLVLVGLSFGAALALHLAATRDRSVDGLVLINPWVQYRHRLLPALPLLRWVLPSVPGVGNDIAKPDADEKPYPRVPLRALASAMQLHSMVRGRLGEVRAPTLLLCSRQDHVAPVENSALILDAIGSSYTRQVWLERSYHVATLDHDAPVVARETIAFVRRVTTPDRAQG